VTGVARVAVVVAALGAAGCSVEIARLVAMSAIPAEDAGESMGRREGQVCRWWVLGVPLGLPTLDGAVNAATTPVGGRLMRDVTVTSDHSVWVLFGQNCYTVRGEVFR
jgi:hypothetical protein